MKNVKISSVALFGIFLILLLGLVTVLAIFYFIVKIETYNQHLTTFEKLYENVLKYQYSTEKLLTTSNLYLHKKNWNEGLKKIESTLDLLHLYEIQHNHDVMKDHFKIIAKESERINTILSNEFFSKKNIMEKSLLRRLGEGLIKNEKSDEYQLLTKLYDSIEYLKQYQEFLLDEAAVQREKNQIVIKDQVKTLKLSIVVFPSFIFIFAMIFSYFIFKKIKKLEEDLLDSKDELEHSLRRLHEIMDAVPVRIFWKDKEGRYLGANNLLLHDAGFEFESQIIGKNDYDMPWKDSQAKDYIQDDRKVMQSGVAKLQFEETQTTPEGKTITLLTSKVPLKDKYGNTIGILGVYNDITQIKQMENDLRTKEKLIYQQSKMAAMGEMLENIAHQWRQPLSLISTSASGVQLQHEFKQLDDAYLLEAMQRIIDSTQHLSDTINDFRDYFKPDKEKVTFPVIEVVEKSLMLLSSKFKNREIIVVNKIEDITFYGYENELVQCVMNILKNSSDALEKLSEQERVVILQTNQSECCFTSDNEKCTQKCDELIITDNAGGIPESIMDRIFEPYFTTKHQLQGTGIGLYMTREMIEHHMNGSISVKNVEVNHNGKTYKGAQFIIALPNKAQKD